MKKLLTLWVAVWILLTCLVTVSSASGNALGDWMQNVALDVVPYAETRIWSEGDSKPLLEVGVRTEARVWKNLELYLGLATGQATTEQSKIHGCNIWSGCSLDAMTNTVKEDDTYWLFKGGIQYRFNLLGK